MILEGRHDFLITGDSYNPVVRLYGSQGPTRAFDPSTR